MLQHARDPLDDRETQAEAAVALVGVGAEPAELLEDLGCAGRRGMPIAGIDHLDTKPHPCRRTPISTPPCRV